MKDIVIAILEKVPPTQVALLAIIGGLIWIIHLKDKSNIGLAREVERLSTLLEILVNARRVLRSGNEKD